LRPVYQIEVQVADQVFIDKRSLYYWSALYHRQLQQGKLYNELNPTVGISILGFEWFKDDERYHHVFHLWDDEAREKLNDDLELHFLELPELKHLKRGPQNALEEWLIYFNDIQGEELEAIAMSNPLIRKALSIEEMFKASAQERRLYDMREKAIFSEATNLAAAEAKGEPKGKVETICQYLEVRFGAESQALQEIVRTITDLDALSRIIKLRNNLKEVREHLGITQNDISQRIGVQKAYYSRLERGEFAPNIKTCLMLKLALLEIYNERTGKHLEKLTLDRLFYLDAI